jgi:hypothetical protein
MKISVRLRWSDLKVMTLTQPLRLPGWIDDPLGTHGAANQPTRSSIGRAPIGRHEVEAG